MKPAFQKMVSSGFVLAASVSIALAAGWYISLLKSPTTSGGSNTPMWSSTSSGRLPH